MIADTRKVKGRGAYGYIESKWVFSAKKKTSRRRLNRQVYYHVYGDKQRNPQQIQRGYVYDQAGDVQRYGDYKAWALGKSRQQNYVYRTHISPKGHVLTDGDFVKAIRAASKACELFKEFRLVIHRDTDNAHAHMLFASDRQWRRGELEAWKVAVREQLMALEQIRCTQQGIPLPGTKAEDKPTKAEPERQPTHSKEKPKRRRRRRRRRAAKQSRSTTLTIDDEDEGMQIDM